MSTPQDPFSVRFDSAKPLQRLVEDWAKGLSQVFEAMAERRPQVTWEAASGPLADVAASKGIGAERDILWWEQPFQAAPEMMVWVGAPRALWEYAGGMTLRVR